MRLMPPPVPVANPPLPPSNHKVQERLTEPRRVQAEAVRALVEVPSVHAFDPEPPQALLPRASFKVGLANCRLIVAFLSLLLGAVLGPSGGSSAGRLGGTFWGLLLEIVGVFSPIVNPNNPSKQPLNCPLNGPKRRDAISREFATPTPPHPTLSPWIVWAV